MSKLSNSSGGGGGVFLVTGQHILSITCPAPDIVTPPRQHCGHTPQVVITLQTLLACLDWIVWSNYLHDNAGLGNDIAAVLGWGFSQFSTDSAQQRYAIVPTAAPTHQIFSGIKIFPAKIFLLPLFHLLESCSLLILLWKFELKCEIVTRETKGNFKVREN